MASGFLSPYNGLNKLHRIPVSELSCLKSAITVGLPSSKAASLTSYHSIAFAIYKALAIITAIDFSRISLTRTLKYSHLDPTEKANISYWIGMTFSALIADALLDVTHLVHATTFSHLRLARINPKSRSLADLVGQEPSGKWHVIEAKARQNRPSNKDENKWKKQAKTISSVDGNRPATSSYSFTGVKSQLFAEFVDPIFEEQEEAITIDFAENALIKGYYGPMIEWLSQGTTVAEYEGRRFILKLAGYDAAQNQFIFLGLEENALNSINKGILPERMEALESQKAYIGSDSVIVVYSHHPEKP